MSVINISTNKAVQNRIEVLLRDSPVLNKLMQSVTHLFSSVGEALDYSNTLKTETRLIALRDYRKYMIAAHECVLVEIDREITEALEHN